MMPGDPNHRPGDNERAAPRGHVRLPPLNLLRTFEAAARHLSFTTAASELFISQSAVSQQIRQLEEFLGVRLFRRLPRRMELTREAIELAASTGEALRLISRACWELSNPNTPTVLCINSEPAFAARWLAPRLKRFMEINRNIRVTLLSSNDPVDFDRQDIDIAIRWGSSSWTGAEVSLISKQPIVAVCSPSILSSNPDISMQDIMNHTSLQVIGQTYWSDCMRHQSWHDRKSGGTLYFSDPTLMIEAALQGQGIGFTVPLLVEDDLAAGRLVSPFAERIEIDEAFHVLCRQDMGESPKIAAFHEWMAAEFEGAYQHNPTVTRR